MPRRSLSTRKALSEFALGSSDGSGGDGSGAADADADGAGADDAGAGADADAGVPGWFFFFCALSHSMTVHISTFEANRLGALVGKVEAVAVRGNGGGG